MMKVNRQKQLEDIINSLKKLKTDDLFKNRIYALDENIIFFQSLKSLPHYIKWVFMHASKIDGKKLEELTDFPIEEWDIQMHSRLIDIQKRDRPGLVKPLVDLVVEFIIKEDRNLIIANLGSGGMEVDRQVISKLIEIGFDKQLILIAIDKSTITHKIAKNNLRELGTKIDIQEIESIDFQKIEEIRNKSGSNIKIILCKNDIFQLDLKLPNLYFDLIYHSIFKHHLDDHYKKLLDQVIIKITKKSFEYDGYKDWPIIFLQTVVGWNYPVFLNAAVFSNLRFDTKKQLKSMNKNITFYKSTGHYLIQ